MFTCIENINKLVYFAEKKADDKGLWQSEGRKEEGSKTTTTIMTTTMKTLSTGSGINKIVESILLINYNHV